MVCDRCGGTGYLPQFRHVAGGVCFKCNGLGVVGPRPAEPAKPLTPVSNFWSVSVFSVHNGIEEHRLVGGGGLSRDEAREIARRTAGNIEVASLNWIYRRVGGRWVQRRVGDQRWSSVE